MSSLPISPAGRRYGLYRDNPQNPARLRLALPVATATVLPPRASTSQFMGPIRDQGNEGSCTGQMGAEIVDLTYRRDYTYEKTRVIDPSVFTSSASFVYKNNLIGDGNLGQDDGSTIHRTMVTLNQKGSCLESVEPYSDHDFSVAPTDVQYANALLYKMGAYHSLPTLTSMKACIASGYSFGFGIVVYESFESDWKEPGMMPMPNVNREQMLGGHAQHGMDYDDEIKFPDGNVGGFRVQNSWGSGWGISLTGRSDGGTYWLPYAFVNANLVNDAWMIHLGPAWK